MEMMLNGRVDGMKHTYHGLLLAFVEAARREEAAATWYSAQITVYQDGEAWYAGSLELAATPEMAAAWAAVSVSNCWDAKTGYEFPWELTRARAGRGARRIMDDDFVVVRVRRATAPEVAALMRREGSKHRDTL